MTWPLDKSSLYTCVTNYHDETEIPEHMKQCEDGGTYVKGLYIEGAAWNGHELIPQRNKELISSMISIHELK